MKPRRATIAPCPMCRHRGIKRTAEIYRDPDGDRPAFRCDYCRNVWTNGPTGGKYARYCAALERRRKARMGH